ncbi:nonsense-mediated mRNA decay protein 3 [Aspergillus uvarum CBS 121591]|uniref:60S ribosomal export protein NMD3 n=1 Tax=Aspergillus uvarum CBS 121591 TaxID=1448315 RepID=A0A319BXU6_9EURO|nr:nonsense-mediated mRNA decay protein 3 [Aspergillus uvarum CBS 121591]PYH76997.1 nonsense-mediated mRNA decay protein 3 [Aspergillus uvarum CBS 121591]
MEQEIPVAITLDNSEVSTPTTLCYECGAPLTGTTLCTDCIKTSVDISAGIQRDAVIHYCRDCERWLSPPATWTVAAPESRELLALCLRKLKRLNKVRVMDASFIWTEPHSRRIKLKLTVQDSLDNDALVQQSFEVTYSVLYLQCPDCKKSYTHNHWRASVQVRQAVMHKRTFLYLEQLILKHKAHNDTINIKEARNGVDFFFAQRNHAEAFVDFLHSVVPIEVTKSQTLISENIHTSKKSYKFSYSVKLVPVCKDDLVALPIKLARQIGNIAPLVLCQRVGTSITFLDPNTLQTADLQPKIYWRAPFTPLAEAPNLVEFIVLDIDLTGQGEGKWQLAEVTVARASDFGGDRQYFTRSHLGSILHPGDSVLGYMITGANFNSPEFEALEESKTYASRIPDVVLVKKHYPRQHKKNKRNWKLKRMAVGESELLPTDHEQSRVENDLEMFLRDVEEDEELRATLALYRNKPKDDEASVAGTEWTDSEVPKINMEELLDDMDALEIHEA